MLDQRLATENRRHGGLAVRSGDEAANLLATRRSSAQQGHMLITFSSGETGPMAVFVGVALEFH